MKGSIMCAVIVLALVWQTSNKVSAGGGGCHGTPAAEGAGSEVFSQRNCFYPAVVRVQPGERVRFENRDEVVHVVVGTQWGGDELAFGAVREYTFREPGTFAYACNLHAGMVGAVVVGDGVARIAEAPAANLVRAVPPGAAVAAPRPGRVAADARPWVFGLGAVIGLGAGAVAATALVVTSRQRDPG